MSRRFWTIATILDFFFCIGLLVLTTALPWWVIGMIYLVGDVVITLVASLADGVDDWLLFALLCIPNYFVMLTCYLAAVDVGLALFFATGGVMAVGLLAKFVAANILVIIIWFASISKRKNNDQRNMENE